MSSEDSDSDSVVSSIDPETVKNEIYQLSEEIKLNPFAYDAHVRRIKLLRLSKEYELLHDAREFMAENFPLTPKLWLEWAADERAMLKDEDSRDRIEDLFKRALYDYQSVDVWLEYCQFAIGVLATSGDLDRTRGVLESALSAQGLDFAKGSVLFEIYREFEEICLVQLESGSVADDAAIKEQTKKIDSIFRRHLAVPHIDLDSTMQEYQEFLKGSEPSSACRADFEAAKKKWEVLEKFELEIADAKEAQEEDVEGESTTKHQMGVFSAWQNYLQFALERATRKGTKANIKKLESGAEVTITPLEMICLYERAITDLCLHVEIWQQAVDYLEMYVSADQERLITTLKRAVRNVTWSSDLWCRYARAVETKAWSEFGCSPSAVNSEEDSTYSISREFDSVRRIFEDALCNAFSSSDELTAVWMGYCDFLLRLVQHSNNPQVKERSIKMLRDNFQRAQSHVSLAFPERNEQEFPLYRYWAFVEVKFLGDIERSREIWKKMLKDGHNGNNPSFWISYLDFLKNHDDIDSLIHIAGMAVNSVTGNYAEMVFRTSRRYLAESGLDLPRLKEFDAKVTLRRQRLKSALNSAPAETEAGNHQQKSHSERSNAPQGDNAPKYGKRKAEATNSNAASKSKRAKVAEPGNSANYADNGESDRPKHGETVIHDPTKDDRTVFISNLPFVTAEEELKSIFQKCGEVVSIRLVRDYAGKSKGFGYVEFSSPDQASSALELDRTPITTSTSAKGTIGRPMFVSVCDTNRSKASGFHYSTGVPEPKKLFVKNLDKVVSEEALKTFFSQHGSVVSVRLATFRNGAPKGHAYVEFATEEEASRALTATDGAKLGSKAISVAISNPPPRPSGQQSNPPQSSQQTQQISSKLKSLANQASVRSRAPHTQLPFMPRALHRSMAPTESFSEETSTPSDKPAENSAASPPKSNADFRKMFLK